MAPKKSKKAKTEEASPVKEEEKDEEMPAAEAEPAKEETVNGAEAEGEAPKEEEAKEEAKEEEAKEEPKPPPKPPKVFDVEHSESTPEDKRPKTKLATAMNPEDSSLSTIG